MCPEYYRLAAQVAEIYARGGQTFTPTHDLTPGPSPAPQGGASGGEGGMALDVMAIREVRLKVSAHIKNCAVCQENIRWAKGTPIPAFPLKVEEEIRRD